MFQHQHSLYIRRKQFYKVEICPYPDAPLDWNRIDTERKLNMEIVSYRNNMLPALAGGQQQGKM